MTDIMINARYDPFRGEVPALEQIEARWGAEGEVQVR